MQVIVAQMSGRMLGEPKLDRTDKTLRLRRALVLHIPGGGTEPVLEHLT